MNKHVNYDGNLIRPISKTIIVVLPVLVIVAFGYAIIQMVHAVVPNQKPWPKSSRDLMNDVADLPYRVAPSNTIVLGKVTSVTRRPENVYSEFRSKFPSLDAELAIQPLGATWDVLEILRGSPAPKSLGLRLDDDVDTTRASEHRTKQALRQVYRNGEYWILTYDHQKQAISESPRSKPIRLNGPNDELLAIYRRHLKIAAEKDPSQSLKSLMGVAASARASEVARVGAFLSLEHIVYARAESQHVPHPMIAMRPYVVQLMKDQQLSGELLMMAMQACQIDSAKELRLGSDDDIILRALLHTVLTGTDARLVGLAAERLYFANNQGGVVNGKYTAFFFPQIIEALETREKRDFASTPGRSMASGALANLKLAGRRHLADVKKEFPVVVRTIPGFINHPPE